MTTAALNARSPIETVLNRFPDHQPKGNGFRATCSAHPDANPSLDITEAADGRVLLKCRAGCRTLDVVAAAGLTMADLFATTGTNGRAVQPPRDAKPRRSFATLGAASDMLTRQKPGTVTRHSYTSTFVVLRADFDGGGKSFRPVHQTPAGWSFGDPPGLLPLFGLGGVVAGETIYVTEGESCVEAAKTISLPTVTSAHGSKSAAKSDWSVLAGKNVVILPDNDAPGGQYAQDVAKILHGFGCTVRIVELPGLPAGGDIVDFIEAHDSRETADIRAMVETIAKETPIWQPAQPIENPKPLAWRPFPVDSLPHAIRAFVSEGAAAIGCDPAFITLPVLAEIASAIGTTRRIRLKRSWSEPSVLWTAVVADSGTLKSPAQDYALAPFKDLQGQRFQEHRDAIDSYEAEKACFDGEKRRRKRAPFNESPQAPKMPTCTRYLVSDTTVEALAPILDGNPRGLLLARDELSGWFGGLNQYKSSKGGDVPAWLEMHRAGSFIVDRKTAAAGTIFVPRAAVSICGGIQPGILANALTDEHFQCGLAARMLFAAPPPRRKSWSDADVDERTISALGSVIERLLDLQHNLDPRGIPIPIDVPLTPDARSLWINEYNTFAERQNEAAGNLRAAYAKLEGYAARFALAHHFMLQASSPDCPDDEIGPASIEFGWALTHWFAHETRRVYGNLGYEVEQKDSNDLLAFIRDRGGSATVRDITHAIWRFRGCGDAVRGELQKLVDVEKGVWDRKTTSLGGRPPERFTIVSTPHRIPETPVNGVETEGFGDTDSSEPSRIAGGDQQAAESHVPVVLSETPSGDALAEGSGDGEDSEPARSATRRPGAIGTP